MLLRLIACTALLVVAPAALAQTLRAEFSPFGLRPALSVAGLDAGWARLSLRFGVRPGRAFEFGAEARRTLVLGPLGNVVLDAAAHASTAGDVDLALQGRGTVANVAARLSLELFNVPSGYFALSHALTEGSRSQHARNDEGRLGLRLAVGLSYRLERLLVLTADPELSWQGGAGLGAAFAAALQLRQLVGDDDGYVLALAALEPDAGRGFAAAGFEYRLNRADWPTLRAAAFVGGGSLGIWPGLRLELGGAQGALDYRLRLAAEPYRLPGPRASGSLELAAPLGEGRLELLVLATPEGAEPIRASLAYSTSF